MKTLYLILSAFLLSTFVVDSAYAKRDRRKGFNFGTTVGVSTLTDRRSNPGDSMVGKQSVRSQSINPYFGYSFGGIFNLGATFSFENSAAESDEVSLNQSTEIHNESSSDLKSGSVFTRLLFGRVLYFEVGGGVYHDTTHEVRTEREMGGDNSFTGSRQEFSNKGMGPGYHLGIGLEIPITIGFHFTTTYSNRIYRLRKVSGDLDLGKKQSFQQKSDLNFGVSYYFK